MTSGSEGGGRGGKWSELSLLSLGSDKSISTHIDRRGERSRRRCMEVGNED